MRLEYLPLLLGVLLGLAGVALVVDAWLGETSQVAHERRRRRRAERNRAGEALVGLGTLAMAAAFLGRDDWDYGTIAVVVGTILLLAGAMMNHHFLYELVAFRGPDRRDPTTSVKPGTTEEETSGNIRLR